MSKSDNLLVIVNAMSERLTKAFKDLGIEAKVYNDGCIVIDSKIIYEPSYMQKIEKHYKNLAEILEEYFKSQADDLPPAA